MDLNFLNFKQTDSNIEQQEHDSTKEDQILKECELYCNRNHVKELLKDCIVQLCLRKPDNPISFLKQHFEKLEKVIFFRCFSSFLPSLLLNIPKLVQCFTTKLKSFFSPES